MARYFCSRILLNLVDMKMIDTLCKKFIFNICTCTANFGLIVSGEYVWGWNYNENFSENFNENFNENYSENLTT